MWYVKAPDEEAPPCFRLLGLPGSLTSQPKTIKPYNAFKIDMYLPSMICLIFVIQSLLSIETPSRGQSIESVTSAFVPAPYSRRRLPLPGSCVFVLAASGQYFQIALAIASRDILVGKLLPLQVNAPRAVLVSQSKWSNGVMLSRR
jgi:hypothetical protein